MEKLLEFLGTWEGHVLAIIAVAGAIYKVCKWWQGNHHDVTVVVEDETLDFKDDVDHGECWNAKIVVGYRGGDFVTVRGIRLAPGFDDGLKQQTTPMRIERTLVKGAATTFFAHVAAVEENVALPDRLVLELKVGCDRLVRFRSSELDRLRPARKAKDRHRGDPA